jgi:hypothetical protein
VKSSIGSWSTFCVLDVNLITLSLSLSLSIRVYIYCCGKLKRRFQFANDPLSQIRDQIHSQQFFEEEFVFKLYLSLHFELLVPRHVVAVVVVDVV